MSTSLEFGIALNQCLSKDLIKRAHLCEELGFDHIWYGNDKFNPDMMIGLTILGAHTNRVKIGSFIIDPYTIHPALTATTAATLDEYLNGRFILGIGAGGSRIRELGLTRKKPVIALEETISIIHQMLAGNRVSLHGEVIFLDDGFLSFPARPDIPIVIGSRGDRVLQLAGRVADGVMIATYATKDGIQHGIDMVAKGAHVKGRNIDDIKIFLRVDCCVLDDSQAARDAVRPMIAEMLMSSYPDQGFVKRLGLQIPEDLLTAIKTQREEDVVNLAHLVPDSFVKNYSWAGNAEEVSNAIRNAILPEIKGIIVLCHAPVNVLIENVIQNFAKEVIPRI
jgi:5,10-methylenetetrahydromethanopterin reductase